MGEPANPTPTERAERQKKAAAIVQSVIDDEEMPTGVDYEGRKRIVQDQVEQIVFDLAHEITLLLKERGGDAP
ncbi:MAG TPA: hypothetical protein VLE97_07275 [Gaiellaceae bacterium]|nr:hypothetical protein [Gaiellaceae bacterium]